MNAGEQRHAWFLVSVEPDTGLVLREQRLDGFDLHDARYVVFGLDGDRGERFGVPRRGLPEPFLLVVVGLDAERLARLLAFGWAPPITLRDDVDYALEVLTVTGDGGSDGTTATGRPAPDAVVEPDDELRRRYPPAPLRYVVRTYRARTAAEEADEDAEWETLAPLNEIVLAGLDDDGAHAAVYGEGAEPEMVRPQQRLDAEILERLQAAGHLPDDAGIDSHDPAVQHWLELRSEDNRP